MSTALNIVDLDSLRAELMMAMLNDKGRQEIWKYDILERAQATREALANQNFDNIENAAKNKNKPFCLVGPGIDDCYFGTVMELASTLVWLCFKVLGPELCVDIEETYANQQAALKERRDSYPWISFQHEKSPT